MIEDNLLQYGVAGIWIITMLAEKFIYQKQMKQIVQNNTIALTRAYENMRNCKKNINCKKIN